MAYVNATTAHGSSTTPAGTYPTGTATDQIAVVFVSCDNASVTFTGTYPAGFTEIAHLHVTADGQTTAAAWKRLTGADSGAYAFSAMGSSSDWTTQMFIFGGRDTGNPPTCSTATNSGANASPVSVDAASVTALAGDDLLHIGSPDVKTAFVGAGSTPPATYTERTDDGNAWTNMSGSTLDNASAGATGTVSSTYTLTSSTAGWAAILVRIPAAGGGGGSPAPKQLAALGVG